MAVFFLFPIMANSDISIMIISQCVLICDMIRGSQTVAKIFEKEHPSLKSNVTEIRDTCLCYRYYYYYEIKGYRHDDIVRQLGNEFFISQDTVSKRLYHCVGLIKNIVNDKPTLRQLSLKYKHLIWR